MKTNIFKTIAATTMMLITAAHSNAQWGLVVIGLKDTAPKEQWYTRDHKDYDNAIYFYGDKLACNEVLDRLLGQYGDDRTTGEYDGESFVWTYFHENSLATRISYTYIGEDWLIKTEVFWFDKDSVEQERIRHNIEMPISVVVLKGRNKYISHQWFIHRNHRNDRKNAIFYYGQPKECITQLDNILAEFGEDHTSGELYNDGFFWFFDQGNGYCLAIFYQENVVNGLSEIVILTAIADFSEEMEFLGIKY